MSEPIAARFARAHRALRTIATTGTNGKTTTTSMIAAIVAASGERSARLTTVGAWVGDEKIEAPSPTDEFLQCVERSVSSAVRTLALEVTSKSLSEGFAQRWPASVAVFTNLTRDHLDWHASAEAYLAAKAQLFMTVASDPAWGHEPTAVLNADDPSSALIAELIAPTTRVRWYSAAGASADLSARSVHATVEHTRIALHDGPLARALGHELTTGARGAVHASNALAAALATHAAGYAHTAIAEGLAAFAGVEGRFEVIHRRPLVVVDYAHTPDGLDGTLRTARALCERTLFVVFGCGGDRDRGKRPEMGLIADQRADVVVLTSDNPRGEEPAQIAAMVREGAARPRAQWVLELDRKAAIERAIAMAEPGDVVVIAGKGHEKTQEIRGVLRPFCDRDEAERALAAKA